MQSQPIYFVSEIVGGDDSNPESLSSNNSKKSIGRLIIKVNSEILGLQQELRKVKTGVPLSKKREDLEKAVKEKKKALEDALKSFEDRPRYIVRRKWKKRYK